MLFRAIIVACFLFMTSTAAFGGSPGNRPFHGKWWENKDIAAGLHLTGDQIAGLNKLHDGLQKDWARYRSEMAGLRKKIKAVFEAEPFDPVAARAALEAAAVRRLGFGRTKYENLIRIRQLLGRNKYMLLQKKYAELRAARRAARGK